jgi:hypothetical protein
VVAVKLPLLVMLLNNICLPLPALQQLSGSMSSCCTWRV